MPVVLDVGLNCVGRLLSYNKDYKSGHVIRAIGLLRPSFSVLQLRRFNHFSNYPVA